MSADLPTYRYGQIPDGMATVSMLARMRRRLARPDQPAVGWYPIRKGVVPLYAIADSVELPKMSAKQFARWTAHRTCARCGEVRGEPVPLCDDGRRVDLECRRLERLAVARVTWLKARMEAVAWARAFHDQPDAAILVGRLFGHCSLEASPVDLFAISLNPTRPLLDVLAWPSPYRNITQFGGTTWARLPRGVHSRAGRLAPGGGAVDCDEITPHLYPLLGRPLVYLTLGGAGHPIEHVERNSHNWSPHGVSLFAGPALQDDRNGHNDFAARWRDWMCEPEDTRHPWAHRDSLKRQPIEADTPAAAAELVLAGLLWMGLDAHPDGPPLCPVLPETGLEPCGEPAGLSGTCPLHAGH